VNNVCVLLCQNLSNNLSSRSGDSLRVLVFCLFNLVATLTLAGPSTFKTLSSSKSIKPFIDKLSASSVLAWNILLRSDRNSRRVKLNRRLHVDGMLNRRLEWDKCFNLVYWQYCNVVLQCFCTYATLISSLWWWWWWSECSTNWYTTVSDLFHGHRRSVARLVSLLYHCRRSARDRQKKTDLLPQVQRTWPDRRWTHVSSCDRRLFDSSYVQLTATAPGST